MEFAAEDGGTEVMPAGEAVDHADVSDLKPWEHSGPERRDVLGAENLILMRDHAIEDVWDRDVVEMARFKGWDVG